MLQQTLPRPLTGGLLLHLPAVQLRVHPPVRVEGPPGVVPAVFSRRVFPHQPALLRQFVHQPGHRRGPLVRAIPLQVRQFESGPPPRGRSQHAAVPLGPGPAGPGTHRSDFARDPAHRSHHRLHHRNHRESPNENRTTLSIACSVFIRKPPPRDGPGNPNPPQPSKGRAKPSHGKAPALRHLHSTLPRTRKPDPAGPAPARTPALALTAALGLFATAPVHAQAPAGVESAPPLTSGVVGTNVEDPALPAASDADPTNNATPPVRRVAIFIKNRTAEALADRRGVFENLLIAELTGQGFEIISPEDVTAALQTFRGLEDDRAGNADGQPLGSAPPAGDDLDALLEQNTSALRFAQNLGVDYLLVASLDALDASTREINRPDLNINRSVTDAQLLTTWKILDAGAGGSLASGSANATARTPQSATAQNDAVAVTSLLRDAAGQIGAELAARGGSDAVPDRTLDGARVAFSVTAAVQDLSVPEVTKDEAGDFVLTGNRYQLEPLSVTVELDGVVIGSAPGTFRVLPGLHKLRLTREKFEPWERTINVFDGQNLQVSLAMTAQGRAEWQKTAALYEQLKQSARGSEDRSRIAQGIEQMLRQSGLKVDTTEGVTVEKNLIERQQVVE